MCNINREMMNSISVARNDYLSKTAKMALNKSVFLLTFINDFVYVKRNMKVNYLWDCLSLSNLSIPPVKYARGGILQVRFIRECHLVRSRKESFLSWYMPSRASFPQKLGPSWFYWLFIMPSRPGSVMEPGTLGAWLSSFVVMLIVSIGFISAIIFAVYCFTTIWCYLPCF